MTKCYWDIYEKKADGTCTYLCTMRSVGFRYMVREYIRANIGVYRCTYEIRIRLTLSDFTITKLSNGKYNVVCDIVAFSGTANTKADAKMLAKQYITELKEAERLTDEQYLSTEYVYTLKF